MLSVLTEELVKRGHEVTLFASGDSITSAKLVKTTNKGMWLTKETRSPHAVVSQLQKLVYDARKQFDIIHNHFGFFVYPLSLVPDCPPILTTFHRPMDSGYMEGQAAACYSNKYYCAISKDQAKHAEEFNLKIEGVVPNGIDINRYPFSGQKGGYLLYLGRLNEEKGVMEALKIAEETGEQLIIAGNAVGAAEWSFFINHFEPKLRSVNNARFVGTANFETKVELLKNAKALLFPIDRREPFGLVMIEAMACGTPVIAYQKGSVPEVVKHGETGFVVADRKQMIGAIKKVGKINRADCRRRVEENFTIDHMVSGYEKIYARIIRLGIRI